MEQSKISLMSLTRLVKEEESSCQKHQLRCFFNHLLLGQWELARSVAHLIFQGPIKEYHKRVVTALSDVATNPYEQSTGSATVMTPEQLSWLALQEYEHLVKLQPQVGLDLTELRKDVEFRLLLVLKFKGIDESLLHEVYQYFQKHHGIGQAYSHMSAFDIQESVSQNISTFITQILQDRPLTGHHLLIILMPKQRLADNKESETLQGLYIQAINALLDGLPKEERKRKYVCDRVFVLLSFYDPEPYWNYLQIRQLFTRLILLDRSDCTNFNTKRVMETLTGRSHGYLMDEFCKLLHEVDVSNPMEVLGDLIEEQRLTLHLLAGKGKKHRDELWIHYFTSCLKWNKHSLGLIMETCISLVTAEQFDTLGKFLSAPELERLKPVVLLACWTYCKSSSAARQLLDTLWTSEVPGTHPALVAGCKKVAYQLSLIKWCLERARPLLEHSETSSQPIYGEQATKMLHGLETHSVLYVLHRSTRLSLLDSQEVLRLLKNVAKNDEGRKIPKNVHFEDDEGQTSSPSSEPVNAEQQHDICIYRSYCAVKNVMDAIVFCYKNAELDLMNPIVVKRAVKPKKLLQVVCIESAPYVSSSEGDESNTPRPDWSEKDDRQKRTSFGNGQDSGKSFEETYKSHVWQKIQQAKEYMQHLYPLAYRVEVMENIFSLLFCRHSDLRDGAIMGEGESDDDLEGESMLTESTETAHNMSVVSEEDFTEANRFVSSLKDGISSGNSKGTAHKTDSAIGSLNSGKSKRTGSLDYDMPFQEIRKDKALDRKLRFRSMDSSDSTRPSATEHSFGFIANEYVVRDVLAMLKDALVDLNAVKFNIYGQCREGVKGSGAGSQPPSKSASHSLQDTGCLPHTVNTELEKVLSHTVRASIKSDLIHKRIAQLTQHIHEAQWRFQVVAHELFPRQPGKVLEQVVVVTDDDSFVLGVEDGWSSSLSSPKRIFPAEGTRAANVKTLSSRRRSLGNVAMSAVSSSQHSIIARMLSSPDSLLTMCLTKGNFPQAAQVIKLLKINEKTREASEVVFTEKFNTTAKSITTLTTPVRDICMPASAKKFNLQAVKSAAAAGVANANLAAFVDDLLATPNIPTPPKAQWVCEGGHESVCAEFFDIDLTTAILLDLACSMCQSWELCNNVFNIIKSRGKTGQAAVKEAEAKASTEDDDDENVDHGSSSNTTSTASCKSKPRTAKAVSDIAHGVTGCKAFFLQMDGLLKLGQGDGDHWVSSAAQEVSAVTAGAGVSTSPNPVLDSTTAGAKGVLSLVMPHSPSLSTASVQLSLIQRFRSTAAPLIPSAAKLYDTSVKEIQQNFELTHQALLCTHLNREDSFTIDESYFSKSPMPKQSSSLSSNTSRTSSLGSGGSSLASKDVTLGKAEMPLLHRRMKHLIATMEKFVPHDGLVKLLIYGKLDRGILKNYLLSMYEHVKELAYLVAECETKSAETLILPKNYFTVLQEGPVDILGRLMFVKRVLPTKLEKVAKKLSLNLTHIIVQSCCPQIPSKHLPPIPLLCPQDVERIGAKCIFNSGHVNGVMVSDPDGYIRGILSDMMATLQEVSIKHIGSGMFTEGCGRQLVKSGDYVTFLNSLTPLQSIDLTLLDSREKRLCFFANLLNLMTLHYHLHTISQSMEIEENISPSKDVDSWGLKGLEGKNFLEAVTKLGCFCYRVGQLGVLSLFELKYIMLHHGQNMSQKWKSLITSAAYKLAPDDPISIFMPSPEPRLLFVVSDGCVSSPPIQVLESNKLSAQLDAAAKSYLSHTVKLDPGPKKVSIPLLLTCLSLDQPMKKHTNKTMFDNLLNFVTIHAEPSQVQILDCMMKDGETGDPGDAAASKSPASKLDVTLSDYSTDFAYALKMEDVAVPAIQSPAEVEMSATEAKYPGTTHLPVMSHSSSGGSISSFLPHRFLLESSGSQVEGKVSMAEPASYQLTPVTLDYVRETSVLVATLLTLLCADELDDEVEKQIADDHFSLNFSRHRTSSDISVVDIRSYRYHRLVDDFPILQRHLLTYIIPLAGADNTEISHSSEPILKFVTNTIDDDVKLCLFSLHNSVQFLDVLHSMATRVVTRRQWQHLIPVLRSIPESVMYTYPYLQQLHDFVISCWAKEFSLTVPKSKVSVTFSPLTKISSSMSADSDLNLLHQLRHMYCIEAQARAVIAVCDGLPVDWGLDLLELCLAHKTLPAGLLTALKSKHHYMSVYHRITTCIKTKQIRLAMQQSEVIIPTSSTTVTASPKELLQKLSRYEDWRHLAKLAKDDPKEVLNVLIQAGNFVVLRDWARLHNLPSEIVLETEVWFLKFLLTADAFDMKPMYQALEDLRKTRPADCLDACQSLLQSLEDQRQVQFLADYMLNNLSANMPSDDLEDLPLRRIGAKALLCIPKSMRGEYCHLVACPHLILEQLLMNMKAELAGKVFEKIHRDFEQIKESKLRVTQDQYNALLTGYAHKALEVTVVQVTDSRSSAAISSPRPSSSGSGSSKEEGRTTPSQRIATDAAKAKKLNTDTPVSITSKVSSTPPPFSASSSIPRRSSFVSSGQGPPLPLASSAARNSASGKFIMPAVAPTEDQWVPDTHASVCMVCKLERFSMFNRRHHCRRCGRVVCAACSTKRSQVRGVLSRICDECYEQSFGSSESRAKDEQEVYSQRMKESLSGASPNPRSSSFGQSPSLRTSDLIRKRSLPSAVHHNVHEWKLNTDEGVNGYIRDEFYYEQAPSVSLCMSILQQHTDSHVSGQLILTMCDDLSNYLQPLAPGIPNLEVDYCLVISIIRELLFRAKMIFLKGGDSGMVCKCDAYQARVDLLKILLEANYPDLPTLTELSKTETARRLRDKLVRDQRLQLALEVCTKCGIEPTGVWLAWGRACLRAGDFPAARTKFAQCLKAPSDKNQTGSPTRLLMEIIDFLESLPPTGAADIQMLITNPSTLSTLATIPVPTQQEETNVESIVYKECTYYLRTYGTYTDHLRFLFRNGYWNKALKFVIDHRCSTDVFVEAILQSTIRQGEMTRLVEQMLMLDASLDWWMPYLSASCKYLLKHKHFHNLYSIQLVMKDYIRAAMTCITHFYQQGAQSYLDLAHRVQFLFIAQEHMNAYLDPMKWGAVRHPTITPVTAQGGSISPHLGGSGSVSRGGGGGGGGSSSAAQLVMSKDDIQRHLRTINLQVEITQFMEQCLATSGEAAAVATQYVSRARSTGSVIPTLFGDQPQRKELAKMILISGDKLQVSFDLVLRILQEAQINAVGVLKLVTCEHLKTQKLHAVIEMLKICEQRQVLSDEDWDEIVSTVLLEITDKKLEVKDETEVLIKMIKKEQNRINALIMTGKLRSAYLTAAKTNRISDVSRIMAAAERMGQAAVRNICKKWLEQHQRTQP